MKPYRIKTTWKEFPYKDLGVGESFDVQWKVASAMSYHNQCAAWSLGRKFSGQTINEDRGDGYGKRILCRITRIS